ncbi:MAG: cob(I)yrinic acid a,c-diamide adenosyltransferase [Lachnospiraceae bacterium]
MEEGKVKIFYGEGRGKTNAAIGRAIQMAAQGKTATIIQFLKRKDEDMDRIMARLEPEIRCFRFEKRAENYENLSLQEREEERINLKNGVNYAKKVLQTGESNLLVLDEILGLIDCKIIAWDELLPAIEARSTDTEVILTGRVINEEIRQAADEICHIVAEK